MSNRTRNNLKIAICVTEDWFALSHFKPVIKLLVSEVHDVVVITRFSGRENELQHLGVRTINFDYGRASLAPTKELTSTRRLARMLRTEQPDIVHLIAMKPIVIGSLAARLARVPATIIHMTGLGHLAISETLKARAARLIAFKIIASQLSRQPSWLLAENPDDLSFMQSHGVRPNTRTTILGGAGVDADMFCPTPQPMNEPPIAACVGRMIRSKGLDVLIAAHHILSQQGTPIAIDLYGRLDDGNPEGLSKSQIEEWTQRQCVNWHGHVENVQAIWQKADIAVLSARSREGMPRALLEAASCARPLVVSDVPGCRHFVRHEVEGLIVPPEDPDALAAALKRLVIDPQLRAKLGTAARQRVLDRFTIEHVVQALKTVYDQLSKELAR